MFILSSFQEQAVGFASFVLEHGDTTTQLSYSGEFLPPLFADNSPNVFEPTPEEISLCLDDLLDQVYGP